MCVCVLCVCVLCVCVCVCVCVYVCVTDINIDTNSNTTSSSRAATIVLREDNCHFLRVDKDDFNRILRVRLLEAAAELNDFIWFKRIFPGHNIFATLHCQQLLSVPVSKPCFLYKK